MACGANMAASETLQEMRRRKYQPVINNRNNENNVA
jgi:hypothetical protein